MFKRLAFLLVWSVLRSSALSPPPHPGSSPASPISPTPRPLIPGPFHHTKRADDSGVGAQAVTSTMMAMSDVYIASGPGVQGESGGNLGTDGVGCLNGVCSGSGEADSATPLVPGIVPTASVDDGCGEYGCGTPTETPAPPPMDGGCDTCGGTTTTSSTCPAGSTPCRRRKPKVCPASTSTGDADVTLPETDYGGDSGVYKRGYPSMGGGDKPKKARVHAQRCCAVSSRSSCPPPETDTVTQTKTETKTSMCTSTLTLPPVTETCTKTRTRTSVRTETCTVTETATETCTETVTSSDCCSTTDACCVVPAPTGCGSVCAECEGTPTTAAAATTHGGYAIPTDGTYGAYKRGLITHGKGKRRLEH